MRLLNAKPDVVQHRSEDGGKNPCGRRQFSQENFLLIDLHAGKTPIFCTETFAYHSPRIRCESGVQERSSCPRQIKPEQALAAVEAQMELHELNAWSEQTGKQIDQPVREYESVTQATVQTASKH